MVGSHSGGSAASHKLIPIWEAYTSAYSLSKQEDVRAGDMKLAIDTQMSELDGRLQGIKKNYDEVEKAIRMKMELALKKAREITAQKVSIILSEKAELQRQAEDIERMDIFLKQNQNSLTPVGINQR
jgi:hypothetical protein